MKANQFYSKILFLMVLFFSTQSEASFRFVVYGDSRGSALADPYNTAVLGFINSQITQLNPRPDFVLFGGDMVYAGSNVGKTVFYLPVWKTFMDSTMDGIPYYTAVGNRDLYPGVWPEDKDLQISYVTTFSFLPSNGPTSPTDYTKLVYSFEFGSGADRSLFVVLDAYGFIGETTTNMTMAMMMNRLLGLQSKPQAALLINLS